MSRRIVQIATTQMTVGSVSVGNLVVLLEDGTLLEYAPRSPVLWRKFHPVPATNEDIPIVVPFVVEDARDVSDGLVDGYERWTRS